MALLPGMYFSGWEWPPPPRGVSSWLCKCVPFGRLTSGVSGVLGKFVTGCEWLGSLGRHTRLESRASNCWVALLVKDCCITTGLWRGFANSRKLYNNTGLPFDSRLLCKRFPFDRFAWCFRAWGKFATDRRENGMLPLACRSHGACSPCRLWLGRKF